MKYNIYIYFLVAMLFVVSGCSEDSDTPEDKKRSSYLAQPMRAAPSETIVCSGKNVFLPKSQANQSVETYILDVHLNNKETVISKISVTDLQKMYRDCIRPRIVERL